MPPIYLEGTLTLASEDRKAFLSLKQGNDVYLDNTYHVARLIPAGELWLREWVSVRAGFAATVYMSAGSIVDYGIGSIGGLTLRLSRRGWYLDLDGFFTARTVTSWYNSELHRSSISIGVTKNLLSRAR